MLYFFIEIKMSRSNQNVVEGILDSENSGFGDFDEQVSIDGSIFRRFGSNAQESSGNELQDGVAENVAFRTEIRERVEGIATQIQNLEETIEEERQKLVVILWELEALERQLGQQQ
ncbi:unnamed protein product [Allacma fusca]|uniref:Uncharacterized protein n=1 Tax=Allacma fusca TaxID=39272 RepID=A0A8J2PST8_9HEXA|nr:unnamed protein product [Allacma fusca]